MSSHGRPSKYTKELQEQADEYAENYADFGDVVPSVVGLADALDIHTRTVQNWAHDEDKPDFLRTLDKINRVQHRVALSKGLTGDFNAAITKLLLHNHGYSDKTDNTLSGPGGGPIETDNTLNIVVHDAPPNS